MVKILIHLTYKIAAVKDRQSEYKLTALNMYLFLLLQCLAVFVIMKVKSNSDSSYFSISNKIVYSEEVIEIFPNISIVQCLLMCKTHTTCHDIAVDSARQCLLLHNGANIIGDKSVNVMRVSAVTFGNYSMNETSANKGTFIPRKFS